MANNINKVQEPGRIISANNDNFYVVSSSLYNTIGFKYIADVYVNNTLFTTLKSYPNPNTATPFGIFNVKNILPTTMSYDFAHSLGEDVAKPIVTCSNSFKNIHIKYGFENYTGSASTFIVSRSLETSSTSSFFNGSVDWFTNSRGVETASYFEDTFLCKTSATNRKFLTNSPTTLNTYSGSMRQWLYFLAEGTNTFVEYEIQTRNSSGTTVGTYYISSSFQSFPSNSMYRIATGYSQLANLHTASFRSGTTFPIFGSTVTSYTIKPMRGGQIPLLETFTYNIEDACSPHKKYIVYWLNRLGGFDSFLFNKKSVESINTSRESYGKNYPYLEGNRMSVKPWSAGTLDYYINSETSLSLISDFLNDTTVLWLKELFTSPVIFIEDLTTGNLVSARIDTNNYELKKTVNQKIYTITFNFRLSYNEMSQPQ